MTEKTDGRNAGPHDYHLSGDGVEPAFQVEFKHFLLSPSSTLDFGFQNCSDMFLFSFKDERMYSESYASLWLVSFILLYSRDL